MHLGSEVIMSCECPACDYRWTATVICYADGTQKTFPPCPKCEERRKYDEMMKKGGSTGK